MILQHIKIISGENQHELENEMNEVIERMWQADLVLQAWEYVKDLNSFILVFGPEVE